MKMRMAELFNGQQIKIKVHTAKVLHCKFSSVLHFCFFSFSFLMH